MDNYINLNELLMKTAPVKKDKISNATIYLTGLTMLKLRDELSKIGKIKEEIIEDEIYVAVIPGGFFKKNYAVLAMQLFEDRMLISAYADEGIIKQHTCEGAIDELKRSIRQFIRE